MLANLARLVVSEWRTMYDQLQVALDILLWRPSPGLLQVRAVEEEFGPYSRERRSHRTQSRPPGRR